MLDGLRAGISLAVLLAFTAPAKDKGPVFEGGERDDAENHITVKEHKDKKQNKKNVDEKTAKAVSTHIKNLKDPDADVRQTSAEMLGMLGAVSAIPDLIAVLDPKRNERIGVKLSAHGALVKITGQNFGYMNYDEWNRWWLHNKEEFLKKSHDTVDEPARLAAISANTVGLELLKMGQYLDAQNQFLDALNKDPKVPDYHNNLGLALLNQGRYIDAMIYFNETIGLNASLPQPYLNIGRCYSKMNKSIEAQAYFKKAIDHDKEGKLWDMLWVVGNEYMKLGEWALAYEYLDQARVKAEKNRVLEPKLYVDLAITHYGLDQYHSAWKELMNVRTLGYEPDPGFVEKVRTALKEQGIDPDEEDKKARDVIRGTETSAAK